jgi:hypothetical protein
MELIRSLVLPDPVLLQLPGAPLHTLCLGLDFRIALHQSFSPRGKGIGPYTGEQFEGRETNGALM